jgi:hypothetical protein
MALNPKDLELIERLIYKNADDTAVAIARSFERIEDRMDATESRTFMRISEVEDKLASATQQIDENFADLKEEVREFVLSKDREFA